MAPPERRMQHVGHGVDAQPISMGTKHDRMQYEMPATHADHGDHMGHDMSDPDMAATMERDMRNKFFVALLLTIPTVLYSPLGMNLLGRAPAHLRARRERHHALALNAGRFLFRLDLHLRRLPFFAAAHAKHERAHRHGRARGLPLQRPDHLPGWRDVLRGRGHARHLRPLWPLDGDALQARHQRRPASALRPGAAAGDGDQGRRRTDDPEQRGASRRYRAPETGRQGAGGRRGRQRARRA